MRSHAERRALLAALQEQLARSFPTGPGTDAIAAKARLNAYAEAVQAVRSVLELEHTFALARQRAPEGEPPSVALVRATLREVQSPAGPVRTAPTTGPVRTVSTTGAGLAGPRPVAMAPLPPTPRFAEAAAWCAANPWTQELVDRELAELTRGWPPALQADAERWRHVAELLVFNHHTLCPARSA